MYIHLNPRRTKAFAGIYKTETGLGSVWVDWPPVESACVVIWPDATSYNLEIAELINAFGTQAEGIPHELTRS